MVAPVTLEEAKAAYERSRHNWRRGENLTVAIYEPIKMHYGPTVTLEEAGVVRTLTFERKTLRDYVAGIEVDHVLWGNQVIDEGAPRAIPYHF